MAYCTKGGIIQFSCLAKNGDCNFKVSTPDLMGIINMARINMIKTTFLIKFT